MMQEELLQEVTNTRQKLVDTLASFKEEEVNIKPFEGSWTAGQVAEHILKSVNGALKTIHGPVAATERKEDEKVEMIRTTFLNFNVKFNAPDFLIPSNNPQQKDPLVHSLQARMEELGTATRSLNLSETCTAFELPGAGMLTRLEWVYFVVYHTQRHTRQLTNIREKLAAV
jgi:hypothetical protein